MRRIISFNKTTEKLLLSGETKNCSYLKTATKVIKKPSKKQGFLSMKNWSIFSFGFMLEDNSYQMMESLPLAELDAIMTTDILVAEGVRQYLLEHPADNPDYFLWFD